MSNQPQKKFN